MNPRLQCVLARSTPVPLGVMAGLVLLLVLAPLVPGQQQVAPAGAVHVITVDEAITPATTRYLRDALQQAQQQRAEVLVVELDTPGGLLQATRDIVQDILNAPVPVVVYIAPAGARGASAGTMITLAAHVAAMAPATHIGAAHPVSLTGGEQDEVMGEKIVNDTAAFVKSIAETRGRNAEWAIEAVRNSESITATEALENNVVEIVAEDLTDLLQQLDGREVAMDRNTVVTLATAGKPLVRQDMTLAQRFQSFISNPNLLFLLLIVGLVGLYIEFSNPGLILPGVVGAISLLLAMIAVQTLPVSYGALSLMLLGAVLLVAESFVPSFGVLGIGGIGSILIGSLFLLDREMTDLHVNRPLILVSVAAVAVIALLIGRLLVRSFRTPPQSRQFNLVGQRATVVHEIAPGHTGAVIVAGERWQALAEEALPVGAEARVDAVDGMRLRVSAWQPTDPSQAGASGA